MNGDKIKRLAHLRILIQMLSMALIIIGSLIAVLVGGLNFQGNEPKNTVAMIIGIVVFALGFVTLFVMEAFYFISLSKAKNAASQEPETKPEKEDDTPSGK